MCGECRGDTERRTMFTSRPFRSWIHMSGLRFGKLPGVYQSDHFCAAFRKRGRVACGHDMAVSLSRMLPGAFRTISKGGACARRYFPRICHEPRLRRDEQGRQNVGCQTRLISQVPCASPNSPFPILVFLISVCYTPTRIWTCYIR